MEIEKKFRELEKKREGVYMPHIYYGDPNEEFSLELIETLLKSGADMLEFGIPFSDPIADGPTFIAACDRALKMGMTPQRCLDGVRKLRDMGIEAPIIMTTYYNIPYSAGIGNFLSGAAEAGVQGLIIPDMPVEESAEILAAAEPLGLDVIFQVAPTTGQGRLMEIIGAASGFLYVVNVEGVTGARESVLQSTLEMIKRVRRQTDLPLMAGFGVSIAEHALSMVSGGADGVITGSAIAKIYESNLESPEDALPEIAKFAAGIKRACIEGLRAREIQEPRIHKPSVIK
ncbi:MAG: tryptophan synthase subunit alpha [Candidatus Hadarchaeota archaeon]